MQYRLSADNRLNGLEERDWSLHLPATLGREPNNDVMINHHSISRYHCELHLDGEGSLEVHDLNSMNGTYVNDEKVSRSVLMTGDRLQLGAVVLRVEYVSDTDVGKLRPRPTAPRQNVNSTVPMRTSDLPRSNPSPQKKWWQLW
ncbi:FHA domain-containing protein [Aeoliella mucimassa]|uniref:Glycogen accumulation regulator GarA n=1 Tax=Aeoliella mucimassa TaxID=2527972 RepID=A0A518ASQ2_9BACT|nr:FHA domain-containing protein [Aeoliella mucimassa]QDU57717.1 Glycogen accumulation regulator GarA [Aeoliella mucimassa]